MIVQIVGEGQQASSWIEFTNANGGIQPGLCYFELRDDGTISRITDFWPDPYELPAQQHTSSRGTKRRPSIRSAEQGGPRDVATCRAF